MACERPEICDWQDNDGDLIIDEGFDADGDSWWACGLSEQHYQDSDFDCDDGDRLIHPGADELCENALDDDCDSGVDEGCEQVLAPMPVPITALLASALDGPDTDDLLITLAPQAQRPNTLVLLQNAAPTDEQSPWLQELPTELWISDVEAWDINNTGWIDLAVLEPETLTGYAVGPSGALVKAESFQYDLSGLSESPYFLHMARADLNSDDLPDLVIAGTKWYSEAQITVAAMMADGNGLTATNIAVLDQSGAPTLVAVEQVDGDALPDIILTTEEMLLWLSRDEGGAWRLSSLPILDQAHSAVVGRLNDDPWPDIAVSIPRRWLIATFLGDGDGFRPGPDLTPLRHPGTLTFLGRVGAKSRLAVSDQDSAQVLVLAGDTSGGFKEECRLATGDVVGSMVMMGDASLATAGQNDQVVRLFDTRCAGSSLARSTP